MRSPYTLTLTAAPASQGISENLIDRVRQRLEDNARLDGRWLAPHEAWQTELIPQGDATRNTLRQRMRDAIGRAPVDVNLVAGTHGRGSKALLVCDMESTIIEQEMIDELAEYAGLREKISAITERAMQGEIPFEDSLRERVRALEGLPTHLLDDVYENHVTVMPGAEALITRMKAAGATCVLVSGGFTYFSQRIADRLGFDCHQANTLEIADGRLTGRVTEPILGREAKREALERLAKSQGVDLAATVAVGDGANDLDMLSAAGLGVAFRAKPRVQDAALAMPNGAVVTHSDLTALLYLQGFARDSGPGKTSA